MSTKLTPGQLDAIRRSDFQRWRDIIRRRGERNAESDNPFLAAVGRDTQRIIRALDRDPSPPSR